MRGKLPAVRPDGKEWRIIPAHAGQTSRHYFCLRNLTDHPRACGANLTGQDVTKALYGSSPRMRGKRAAGQVACEQRRIIPAHAGQTRAGRAGRRPAPDHPRACGANSALSC